MSARRRPESTPPRTVGLLWEEAVAGHLCAAGLVPLARNFQCRHGEIDLVMRDRDCVVFVEVRFRHSATHGDGAASIGAGKRRKLRRAASVFLQRYPALRDAPCRFDVVACQGTTERPEFDWIRAAFED
jgi:putative endonuclease